VKKSVTVLIGNSDDKLTQKQWHDFVNEVDLLISSWSQTVWFFGASPGFTIWQNAAWVFEMMSEDIVGFSIELTLVRERFYQDSVALIEGLTQLI